MRCITLRTRDNDVDAALAKMNEVTLKELRGDVMLFTGEETEDRVKYRQAWLCRLLTEDEKRAIKATILTAR